MTTLPNIKTELENFTSQTTTNFNALSADECQHVNDMIETLKKLRITDMRIKRRSGHRLNDIAKDWNITASAAHHVIDK